MPVMSCSMFDSYDRIYVLKHLLLMETLLAKMMLRRSSHVLRSVLYNLLLVIAHELLSSTTIGHCDFAFSEEHSLDKLSFELVIWLKATQSFLKLLAAVNLEQLILSRAYLIGLCGARFFLFFLFRGSASPLH